jgi:hypothetical protein
MRGDHDTRHRALTRDDGPPARRGKGVLAGKPAGRPLGRDVLAYGVGIAFWFVMILMCF